MRAALAASAPAAAHGPGGRGLLLPIVCATLAALLAFPVGAAAAQRRVAPTFTRDLAPVLFEHCAPCHRPGGSAPFALLTYDDVRARARQVVGAVTARQMPPWKPEGARGEFAGDRRLSDTQVALFTRWLAAGAPRGELRDLPAVPAWPAEWELGTPDLVARLERPFVLPAGGADRLRNFVVRLPLGSTRYVRAWEFRTTNPGVVHHATLMVDRGGGARRLDDDTPESGWDGLIPFTAQSPDGYFLGWTPGQRAQQSPPDIAWRLDAGDDLIVMLHLQPGESAEQVDASVALYFTERPPSHAPVMIRLNRQDLDIPAGAPSYLAEDAYTVPVDVDLYALQPHAHYLARRVSGAARAPDGSTRPLLQISAWDFHWQDVYRYRQPLRLPAGTRLSMTVSFDNSPANRANPNRPPVRVIWGQRSSDEMADLWLQVVPVRESDRDRLVADLRRKLVPQHLDGYRKMLDAQPDNPALHDDVALLAVEAGDTALARTHFQEVARLRPQVPASHYNLANALLASGAFAEALAGFREALRLDPSYGLAHQGMGLVLAGTGRLGDAVTALETAARLLPASAEPLYNLGVVRQQQQRDDEALAAYERAIALDARHAGARYGAALIHETRRDYPTSVRLLREALGLRPGWPQAQVELAWLLAAAPDAALRDPGAAVRLVEAVVRTRAAANARELDVLAAALAAAGRHGEAAQQQRAALERLRATPDPLQAAAMSARLALYERRQPFLLP